MARHETAEAAFLVFRGVIGCDVVAPRAVGEDGGARLVLFVAGLVVTVCRDRERRWGRSGLGRPSLISLALHERVNLVHIKVDQRVPGAA